MTEQRSLKQEYDGQTLDHVIVHDETGRVLPTVIIIPTVMGVQPLEIGFAEKLVELGYHVVIADLFGRRFTPGRRQGGRLCRDGRTARRPGGAARSAAGRSSSEVRERPHVDKERIAVIGYCFGGQCALDVARSGADVAGVAAFHGLFDPPGLPPMPIKAKVAAYHGWNDPMVPPEAVVALGNELTEGGADWQIHCLRPCRPRLHQPQCAPDWASRASPIMRRPSGAAGPA